MQKIRNLVELRLIANEQVDEKKFWHKILMNSKLDLNLNNQNKKNENIENTKSKLVFELSDDLINKISKISAKSDSRLFVLLVSNLALLLYKYNSYLKQSRFIVGSPILSQDSLVELMNTYIILDCPIKEKDTFRDLLNSMKGIVQKAFKHQNYPFDILKDELSQYFQCEINRLFNVGILLDSIQRNEYLMDVDYDLLFIFENSDKLRLVIEYDKNIYNEEGIILYKKHYMSLLDNALSNMNDELSDIHIINKEEKQSLLYEFNNTKVDYLKDKTIHKLFEEQVEKTPDDIALVFENKLITYKELNIRSNQIAHYLIDKGVQREDIVGIELDSSYQYVACMFAVLKSGGAFLPIHKKLPDLRKEYIVENSELKILIHNDNNYEKNAPENIESINIQKLDFQNYPLTNPSLEINSSNLAYVIYTSGSTGKPKGTLLEHKGIVNENIFWKESFKINADDKCLQFANISFDASVAEIYSCLFNGASLYIPDENIKKDTILFQEYLMKNQITVATFPPPLADNLNERAFKNFRLVITAGSETNSKLIEKINKNACYLNAYGPTETSICATCWDTSEYNKIGKIVIGRPIQNIEAYIIDSHLQLQGIGIPGELCFSGEGLARAYLKNPELTAEKFISHPFKEEERLYRTGDLARWLADGNIEFLGRIDHQVKIRGFRIELGEIESTLLKHENIKESVVLAIEKNNEKYLCAYVVCIAECSHEELRAYMSAQLPDYMIPSYFVELESLPLTTNGKVNRKALPAPEIKAGDDYVAPSNEIEEKLVEIWSEVLNIEKEAISVTANFFAIGGHSLKATVLTGKIHKETGVEFPLRDVFIHSSIKAQAQQIEISTKKDFVSISKAKAKDCYAQSSAQKRLYLLHQIDLSSTAYNMPYIIPLGEEAEKEKIEEAFRQLISRHESFRTSFEVLGEEPVQRIHEQVEFKIEEFSIEKADEQNIGQQFIQPFDLSQAPLLRVALVEIKEEGSLLMIDMHHIISDGASQSILEDEFQRLYAGEELLPLSLQYKDYSQWQNSAEQKTKVKDQENYWINKFEGEIPVLNLPNDYLRPAVQSHEGARVSFAFSNKETKGIKSLAQENDLTLYMTVLSVFSILLSKLSGQEDIIVGTPIAGRNHNDLENIVGMFVNTLAIRNEVNGSNTLKEFLGKTKQNTLEVFENQDYQFEELVENISIERDISRNPLFDVMFNFLNQTDTKADLSGLESNKYVHNSGLSKFDLTLSAADYGEQMMLSFEYCTKLFKVETIERYIGYFKQIVNQLAIKSEIELSAIEIISSEEKQQLLFDFNATKIDFPRDKAIHDLFEEQVKRIPNAYALVRGSNKLTYKEFNQEIDKLSKILINKGIKCNDFIAIFADQSIEFLISIFAVLKAGGAYVPIDDNYPESRKNYIIKDCDAKIILSTKSVRNNNKETLKGIGEDQIVNVDELDNYKFSIQQDPIKLRPDNLIYLIYTSGSTGNPKGAAVYHKGFANLLHWFINEYTITDIDRVLLMSSTSFDLTQKNLFAALLCGGSLHLLPTSHYDPDIISDIISKEKITWINCTPSAFYPMVEVKEDSLLEQLNSLRFVFLGGEPISMNKLSSWLSLESNKTKLVNTYGPTEATDICASFIIENPLDYRDKIIPIGKPIYNVHIFILDKNYCIVPIGISGELCISGAGLALGYLNNTELTSDKFIAHPYKEGERLYRTGDLARWLSDGKIEFLGRIDNQVKIRGFRIELGEIESLLQKHDQIKDSLVIDREENGDKYLCAYLVTEENFNEEEIRSYLSVSLPDYMIPSYFIALDEIPLTPNGKVDRKALPSPEVKAGDDYVAPSNEREEKLVEIWSEVLNIEKEDISVTANFFAIGGHSLKATILIGRIHKEIGVEFPLRDVFIHSNIKAQAGQIEISTKKDFVTIPKAKAQNYYALSSAQKRLYLLQQMDLDSTAYNMPYIIPLGAEAVKEKIEEVFHQLISRHESFRTSFEIEREEPVQRIHEQVEFKLEEITITKEEVQEKRQQFIQAFDLRKAPLLRVSKVEVKGEESLLMIDMHHIISDGVSHAILEQDFRGLYSGEALPPLSLQYKDYSEWQNSEEQQARVKGQEDYWINKFEEEIPVLDLPVDYARPAIQSHEGVKVSFALSKEETDNIKLLAEENGLTLYMSVLSAFNILLSKLSGQEDIIVGTPIAGRNHSDLENIVGVFINTLAIRNEVNGSNTLKEFLGKLKQRTLETYENQDYQFEDLVDKVSVERDVSRNPLFDVMFNLLNHADYTGDLSDLGKSQYVHTPGISKFDLSLTAVDYGDQLLFSFVYCTHLFKPDSIERFIGYFKQIISQITQKTDIKLSEINIISSEEKQQLLFDFNNTKTDYPKDKTIHQLFEKQAKQTPDRIALVFNEQLITYKELNIRSNQLAQLLLSKGLKPEDIVGILVDRSIEMIIGILGILKARGTYLPLDIQSPKERIEYIIQESALRIILSQVSDYKEKEFKGELINLFDSSLYLNNQDQNISQSKSSDAAYIIYTSGSTGKPKGVIVEHGNVVNLVNGLTTSIYNNYQETLHVSLISPIYFDASVKQIFPSLTLGIALDIIPETTRFEGLALVKHYTRHDIQIADGTPFHAQMLAQYVDDKTQGLNIHQFVIGGDELKLELMQSLFQKIEDKNLKISNVYDPTECTDVTTIKTSTIESLKEKVNTSIGKPISNYEILILGKNLELLPIGVPGELCISGAGVSRGYLFNKELTSEKFIKHPYKEEGRLYKTGDLACWLPDGDIEFLGRIDYQVKIRGFRIELGEIENVLQKHASIKESVVIAREENGDKYLCAHIVTEEEFNKEEIRTYLSASLPDYMIPSYFVQLEKLPLTSNGKVNRKALPAPEIKAGNDYVAPSNATEQKLVEIWSELLNVEKEEISAIANFFAIGGHSLKVVILASRVHALFDVDITIKEIFSYPTIKDIAKLIEASELNRFEEEIEDVDYESIRV